MSDNVVVVAYLKKHGGMVFRVMCDLALEILTLAEQFAIFLTASTFMLISPVVWISCIQLRGLFFLGFLRTSAGSIVILSLIFSLQESMQNCPCMCLQFLITWLGRRTPSSTVGTVSLFMLSLFLLFQDRSCREL